MTKEKAERRLRNWRNHLEFWQEAYVENERDNNELLDIIHRDRMTIRELNRTESIQNMNEAKVQIARFERMVKMTRMPTGASWEPLLSNSLL